MRKCDSCFKERPTLKRLSKRLICKTCEMTKFVKCEVCSKLTYYRDLEYNTDKHKICKDCGLIYDGCINCGEVLNSDEEYVCETCEKVAKKGICPICSRLTNEYEDIEFDGAIYCSFCFHSTFESCDECEGTFLKEQVNTEKSPYMCHKCMIECGVID